MPLTLPADVDIRIYRIAGKNRRRDTRSLSFDDLVQVGREAALRALAANPDANLSYLCVAADWRMRDAQRAERVRAGEQPEFVPEPAAEDDRLGEVIDTLGQLPARQREAVTLTVLLGWPYQDAAARLGISVGAFKTLRHRGIENLRGALAA